MKLFGLGYNQHGQIDADHCLNIILKPSQYMFSQSTSGIFTSLESVVSYNGSYLTVQGFCCGQPKVKACIKYDAAEPVCSILHWNDIILLLNLKGCLTIFLVKRSGDKFLSQYSLHPIDKIDGVSSVCSPDFSKFHIVQNSENGASISVTSLQFKDENLIPCLLTNHHFLINKSKITQLSCGKDHFLVLTNNGNVMSWGLGSRGQLGLGDVKSYNQPTVVESLGGVNIIKVVSGYWHNLVLSETHDVYVWGWNEKGQLGFPCAKNVNFCETVLPDTALQEKCNMVLIPSLLELECYVKPTSSSMFLSVVDISCGSQHSAAVLDDGRLLTWGFSKYGQCEIDNNTDLSYPFESNDIFHKNPVHHSPRVVEYFWDNNLIVKKVTCSGWYTVAIIDN